MDSALKEHLNFLMDKLEDFLFNDAATLTQDQIQYYQPFFATESYLFSANLLRYFKQELFVGFAFNLVLFAILCFYLPFNFAICWKCNVIMTIWLLSIGLLNTILIIPKAILLRKVMRIEEAVDIYLANYSLWIFFKSKVYKFNNVMSRYIFCAYVVGIFVFVLTNTEVKTCERFYGLMTFLFGSFAVRAVFGFLKFVHNVNATPEVEVLNAMFNGISHKQMTTLKSMKIEEYKNKFNRDDEDCPICYVDYKEGDEVRCMECEGQHAFHKKCIDQWLVRSKKCPKCRMSVFHLREAEKSPSKIE